MKRKQHKTEVKTHCRKMINPKPCRCCCPTCREKWIVISDILYPDRLNWIYCETDKKNKFKRSEGYNIDDCRGVYSDENKRDMRELEESEMEEREQITACM